jgi:hypothetical protein
LNEHRRYGRSTASVSLIGAATLFMLPACGTVEDALDPDCTAESAARNIAMQTTIGVGNRCGPGETVRDMTGTDGTFEEAQERLP